MGNRPAPPEILWTQGVEEFAFLLEDWDFDGPERTGRGIAYHRPDLHIWIEAWAWHNDAGFDTTVQRVDRTTGARQSARLDELYVAGGLGPVTDVPSTIAGGHTLLTRVRQHARALRLLMPELTGPDALDLFQRSGGRATPYPAW